jgi:hypothetical protein
LVNATGSDQQQGGAHSLQQSTAEQQAASGSQQQDAPGEAEILIPPDEANHYRTRWDEVQTGFVDDPRQAVEDANQLVDEVTNHVVETFTRARSALEEQWSRGDDVNTEELRVVFQRYRSFLDSLLKRSTSDS